MDLYIDISNRCNNFCQFCFQRDEIWQEKISKGIGPKYICSFKEVKSVLDKYKNIAQAVTFTGGESTLNRKLPHFIKYAANLGYVTRIITNGRNLADKNYTRSLIRAGLKMCIISFESSNENIHNQLICVKDGWRETVKGIDNMISLAKGTVKTGTITVINSYNYKTLPSTARFLINKGIQDIQFNFIYHLDKRLVPRFSQFRPYLRKALDLCLQNKVSTCTYGLPICAIGEEYLTCIGDLKNRNDRVVEETTVQKKEYKEIRLMGKKKTDNCKKCKYNNICEGVWFSYINLFGKNDLLVPYKE